MEKTTATQVKCGKMRQHNPANLITARAKLVRNTHSEEVTLSYAFFSFSTVNVIFLSVCRQSFSVWHFCAPLFAHNRTRAPFFYQTGHKASETNERKNCRYIYLSFIFLLFCINNWILVTKVYESFAQMTYTFTCLSTWWTYCACERRRKKATPSPHTQPILCRILGKTTCATCRWSWKIYFFFLLIAFAL